MKNKSFGYFLIVCCFFGLIAGLVLIAVAPSPIKQVESAQVIQQPVPGTELWIAYGKEGPAEPRIVRIRALSSGGHELIADLGKIDDKP